MSGLIMAGQLILGLSILVTLHELGHFLAARAFGIKVEKFYLFFDAWNVKLFSFKKGDTEYGIGWLPLGGYVKIAGMIDESLDKEQLSKAPEPWEFRSKPAWQRLIVMIAGVTMNVILGIVIFSLALLTFRKEYLPVSEVNRNGGIVAYTLGREIGLQDGDKIITLNGKEVERFDDLLGTKVLFGSVLGVDRNGQRVEIVVPDNFYRRVSETGRFNFIGTGKLHFEIDGVTAGESAEKSGIRAGDIIRSLNGKAPGGAIDLKEYLGAYKKDTALIQVERDGKMMDFNVPVNEKGTIGISFAAIPEQNPTLKASPYTLASAFRFGTADAVETLVSNIKGLGKIFSGEEKASDSVQGPIGIAQIYGGSWDWARFWAITGLLSMVLAFMNMLPIPALDGGHVVFLLIESITGMKFSDQFMEKAQIVGMVILLSLMAFAVGNDLWKHVLN